MSADCEAWIIEIGWDLSERKERSLTPLERLIEKFWFIDYCMRNGGDLANLADHPGGAGAFLREAAGEAKALGFWQINALMSLAPHQFEQNYLAQFELVCGELRTAYSING